MSDPRQHVHELIDQLPPSQLAAVAGLLESMLDPMARAIRNAPIDDEPISDEEEQAVARSKEWFKHHEGCSLEDLASDMGISMNEIRNAKG